MKTTSREEALEAALTDAQIRQFARESTLAQYPGWVTDYRGFDNLKRYTELVARALAQPVQPAPLTDERIHELWVQHGPKARDGFIIKFARALEAEPLVQPAGDALPHNSKECLACEEWPCEEPAGDVRPALYAWEHITGHPTKPDSGAVPADPSMGHAWHTGCTPTYNSWRGMFGRCEQETHDQFPNYGARGIRVCERWREFANFLADLGPRPQGRSLDRIDTNGHYEPGNCQWSTEVVQQNNRRDNHQLTAHGRTQTVTQWAKEVGVPASRIFHRLRAGWVPEKAIDQPTRPRKKHVRATT